MHCSAVKYNESSKLCELGNIEKLDCRADKVSSNLTTTLFKVVKNGEFKLTLITILDCNILFVIGYK